MGKITVERLKPPVPERPKLVSRNLQTKDVLDENLEEENRERNNEKSEKDGKNWSPCSLY